MLDPNSDIFKVDAYFNDDFSGIHRQKNHNDLACAKSCTGFMITFSDCIVLCISKLKTEPELSTMKSEIISLAHCCQHQFPKIDFTQSIGKKVGLLLWFTSMKVSTHNDNSGAIFLGRIFPPKCTPRSKYYETTRI